MEDPSEDMIKGRPMEKKLQVRIIPRILAVHLIRQRQQRALWIKGLAPLEKASMSILLGLLLLRFVLHLHFSLYIFFLLPYIFHFAGFTEISFLDRGGDRFIFGLVFPRSDYSFPLVLSTTS